MDILMKHGMISAVMKMEIMSPMRSDFSFVLKLPICIDWQWQKIK